ncbi:NAD(P)H-binding protein [Streptomyces sp. NPDC006184]|uniref:NAD(P)H-binding protein n=1 Tax=Streptomyces sp. NPDC006184 TaxID=3155455 RepID=UPI0033BC6528
MIGCRIAAEAVRRGHHVVAASRSGAAPLDHGPLTGAAVDASAPEQVADAVRGADVVVSALVPPRDGCDCRKPFAALNEAFRRACAGAVYDGSFSAPPRKAGAASARARGHGGTGSGLQQLSKAELYQRATRQDVAGRSRMSRQDLIDALAHSGRRRKRSAA